MERTTLGAAIVGLVLAAAGTGEATAGEDSGWYAGAGVGQSSFDLPEPQARLYVVDYEQGESTESYQLLAGYRTSPYLALELSYVRAYGHTSEFTLDCGGRITCQGYRVDVGEEARSQRLDVAVVATLPIGQRVELFGKLGLSRSRHRLYWTTSYTGFGPPGLAFDDMRTGLVKGWGGRLKLSPVWAVRAQYESADQVGGKITNDIRDGRPATVDNWWLGAEYRF